MFNFALILATVAVDAVVLRHQNPLLTKVEKVEAQVEEFRTDATATLAKLTPETFMNACEAFHTEEQSLHATVNKLWDAVHEKLEALVGKDKPVSKEMTVVSAEVDELTNDVHDSMGPAIAVGDKCYELCVANKVCAAKKKAEMEKMNKEFAEMDAEAAAAAKLAEGAVQSGEADPPVVLDSGLTGHSPSEVGSPDTTTGGSADATTGGTTF